MCLPREERLHKELWLHHYFNNPCIPSPLLAKTVLETVRLLSSRRFDENSYRCSDCCSLSTFAKIDSEGGEPAETMWNVYHVSSCVCIRSDSPCRPTALLSAIYSFLEERVDAWELVDPIFIFFKCQVTSRCGDNLLKSCDDTSFLHRILSAISINPPYLHHRSLVYLSRMRCIQDQAYGKQTNEQHHCPVHVSSIDVVIVRPE